jgi:hypothetical protein
MVATMYKEWVRNPLTTRTCPLVFVCCAALCRHRPWESPLPPVQEVLTNVEYISRMWQKNFSQKASDQSGYNAYTHENK